jgi:hypothetical protein
VAETDAFKHSTPALYDRYMGSLLFEPYAKFVAERLVLLQPVRILETAAGTGIVTRAVNEAVPQAVIVATDINAGVVEFAAQLRVRCDVLPGQGPRERRSAARAWFRWPVPPRQLRPPGGEPGAQGGGRRRRRAVSG